MEWRTVQVPRALALTRELTIPMLLKAIAKNDFDALKNLRSEDGERIFSPAEARKIIENLGQTVRRHYLQG